MRKSRHETEKKKKNICILPSSSVSQIINQLHLSPLMDVEVSLRSLVTFSLFPVSLYRHLLSVP